jgi:phospholipid/cholesterol/gamma-HCH transport system permease protein
VFLRRGDDARTAVIELRGTWRLAQPLPDSGPLAARLKGGAALARVGFDSRGLGSWDSGLLVFLARLYRETGIGAPVLDEAGLPEGARRLLALARATPPGAARGPRAHHSLVARVGETVISHWRAAPDAIRFVGELALSLGRLFAGRAQYRAQDFWLFAQEAGPGALPIVSLISFLVGLILAYMGAVQLAQFGAQIYIADLVGIGMVREIGALMTGIILAGRTGASYAAQIGTMQVNEEIDALRVLGVSPVDFLVLPRFVALVLMVPLLTLYAGVVGTLAGMVVATAVFDVGAFEYYHEVVRALDLRQFVVGLSKGITYGALVAFAGCLRGMQCGRSAQAVGEVTTSAVVTAILLIVISASILTILYQELGI